MIFHARVNPMGEGLAFPTDYARDQFKKWLKASTGIKVDLIPLLPENRKVRKFYHGAVLTLWAFLNGYDHKDPSILRWLHEVAKLEFNAEFVNLDGKQVKKPKSTKGELGKGFIERVIEHLEEQYGINRQDVLDPAEYKKYRDEIQSFEDVPDDYISYLVSLGKLKKPQ